MHPPVVQLSPSHSPTVIRYVLHSSVNFTSLGSPAQLRHFHLRRPYPPLPPWNTSPLHHRPPHHRLPLPLFPLRRRLLSGPSIGVRRLLITVPAPLPPSLIQSPPLPLPHHMHLSALVEVAILQSQPRCLLLTRRLHLLSDMRYMSPLRKHLHHLRLLLQPPQNVLLQL